VISVPEAVPQEPGETLRAVYQTVGCEWKRWHPPAWKGARTEIARSWEIFGVEFAGQGEIGHCAVFRMNCWMFGNPNGFIGDPEANQTF
jgi:hypothetical protein